MGNLEVVGYLDYDFVDCVNFCISILQYIFMMIDGAIPSRSNEINLIATSTIKFVFCFKATHGLWFERFI
jgi:hypothetical protein